MGGSLEGGNLTVDGVASADHFGEDLGGVFGKAKELFADLFGEFTGGSEDEALDALLGGVDFGEERESEGCGLSCSSLSLGDEVSAILLQAWDGVVLDLGGLADAEFFETFDKVF